MLPTQVLDLLSQTADYIFVPTNKTEYEQLSALLDNLIDLVREDETHPLAKVMNMIGVLIEDYEEAHFEPIEGNGIVVLRHLMNEHNLRQKDLAELGSQGVVSEILNEKHQLNLRQIQALSQRFGLSPAAFI